MIVGLEVGGAEGMLERLVSERRRVSPNAETVVVSLTNLGSVGERLKSNGIEVVALGMRSALGIPVAFVRLVRLFIVRRPDVVQTWMVHADLIGGLAARFAKIQNVVWGVRTTDFSLTSRSTQFVRLLCAKLSRVVPSLIVCAANASRLSHEAVGYDASRMRVIPNGFDLGVLKSDALRRESMRAEIGISSNQVVIGHVGRYNVAKDHANFINAAALLAKDNPSWLFLMVGRGVDENNTDLMALLRSTGFVDRFILRGQRSDVPAHLDAMDIFVLSSLSEGFPNVVGEAMAMELPCVVTDVGDAAWLVGDAGIVVPKADSPALAHAIGSLARHSEHDRRARGVLGRRRVEAMFSMENAVENFESLYFEMTESEEDRKKGS